MVKKLIVFVLSALVILLIGGSVNLRKVSAQHSENIKVLAIGNSFSEDALTYLRDISVAGGSTLDLYHLVIGGSSLEQHWRNAERNTPAYTFVRKEEQNISESGKTLAYGLEYEEYDYIVIQQVSGLSGIADSYEPYLSNLISYIRGFNTDAVLMIHQTWAYEKNSTHVDFPRYNKNQETMYEQINTAVNIAAETHGLNIIPCGEAVHKARENARFDIEKGGVSLCRDGYHMADAGRVLLGLVWNGVFTGNTAADNPFKLDNISAEDMKILKEAADYAIEQYRSRWIMDVVLQGEGEISVLQNDQIHSKNLFLQVTYQDGQKKEIALDILSNINTGEIGKQEQSFWYWAKQFKIMINVISREKVDNLIENIKNVVRFPNIDDIKSLLSEYNSLSDIEKDGITNYSDLIKLKEQYLDNNPSENRQPDKNYDIGLGAILGIVGGCLVVVAVIIIIILVLKKR